MTVSRFLVRFTATLLLAVSATTAASVSTATAAENEGWAVFPSAAPGGPARNEFIVDLRPGTVVEDSISITNKTDAPLAFDLYAADAYNTDVGSFSLRLPDEPREGMGAWTILSTARVDVGPGAVVDVPFSIQVPADASPGDHAGGIVARSTEPVTTDAGEVQLDVLQAVGVRIYGRVAGPLAPSLEFTELHLQTDTGPGTLFGGSYDATLQYTVTNTGNVRLVPTTGATLEGLVFDQRMLANRELPELLPGGSATVVEQVGGLRPTGPLTAALSVTAPSADPVERETRVWEVPWALLALLVVLVIVVAWRRRRRRTVATSARPERTRAPESVGA